MLNLVSVAHEVLHAEALPQELWAKVPSVKKTPTIPQFKMLVTCPLLRPGPNCTAVPVSRELRHLTRTLLALRELCWPGENSASTARTLPTACPDQIRSVTQSCPTLCDPMNSSTPGLPVCPSPTPGVHSDSRPSSR